MTVFSVMSLFGGLAFFLYGMNTMNSALEKLGGGRLKKTLEKLTSGTVKSVLLGMAVTAVIQSSSATTVMVVGFVSSGIMSLTQAVGVIMGANIGTTVTAWILSLTGIKADNIFLNLLKPAAFAPALAFVGLVLTLAFKDKKKNDIGYMLFGFALLMNGMELMSSAVKPLAREEWFSGLFLAVSHNPIIGVLAGTALTAIIQSSSASVGILQALSATGAITFSGALPIILGQNIGTCATALLSCIGANKNARRAAVIHLYFNVVGVLAFSLIFYGINAFVHFDFFGQSIGAVGIALMHTVFNVFTTVLLLPFNKQLVRLARLTVRDKGRSTGFLSAPQISE